MKTRSWSTGNSSVTMEYVENPYQVQDYQMITKHLREKVHQEKLQGRRARRGRIGTATALQNRGLHNYPMQYNREDIRSAKWSPDNRQRIDQRTNVTKLDSTALKQHCKDMFDFAVKNAPQKVENTPVAGSAIIKETRAKRTKPRSTGMCSHGNGRDSTGPTLDGSFLHNHRARVLNSIRVRHHSEAPCRYNHDRSSSQQSLRETLSHKSSMYQILDLNPQKQRIGSSSSCASSSLMFIPRSQGSVYSDVFELGTNQRPSTVTDLLSEMDVSDGARHYEDSVSEGHEREGGPEMTAGPQNSRLLLPPETPCSMRLVTLEEETSSESGSECKEPDIPKEPPPPPTPAPKKGKGGAQPEREPEEPAPPPKLILKGPHCWVDDVTVTSSHPDDEEIEGLEPQQPGANECGTKLTNAPPDRAATDDKDKVLPNGKDKLTNGAAPPLENTMNGINGEVKLEVKQECTGNGEKQRNEEAYIFELNLPTFICPSSEKKSREAAIKDWLSASHNFFSYPRPVPML